MRNFLFICDSIPILMSFSANDQLFPFVEAVCPVPDDHEDGDAKRQGKTCRTIEGYTVLQHAADKKQDTGCDCEERAVPGMPEATAL